MLEFDEAQARLLATVAAPGAVESCPLIQGLGRVLAHDISATLDLPPADNSAMDGYAVRHADLAIGRPLPVGPTRFAGQVPPPLPVGHAARIFTGGLVPEGADTVVIQEDCEADAGTVRMRELTKRGANIRRQGEDVAAGSLLLAAGTVLGPGALGLLSAQGLASLPVRPRLKVAVLTTGDELVAPGRPLSPGAIYESNGTMLRSVLAGLGCEVVAVRHAIDDLAATREALTELASLADLVVSAGGVSVGDRDLIKPALQALGGDLDLWKVRMKPGKPVALGRVGAVPVLGLPGNPVSTYVVLAVLASPMIRHMQGRAAIRPRVSRALLRAPREYLGGREEFLRVREVPEGTVLGVQPHPRQGSGILHGLAWADGVARIPAGLPRGDGDEVDYYRFADWLA
ncbi:MAG: molybdopterin molybdotransferase MoeA [Pigmentiphaga sp.]|nr:molybdopterin molybdotransferase MoeA [Pigmentiphaga sp.]